MSEHLDYRLPDLPGYRAWSQQRLAEGESEAMIAHLDATCAWLSPEDVRQLQNDFFDELLADLRESLAK